MALRYKRYIPKDSPLLPSMEYKLAELYLKAGYADRWKKILSSIKQNYPGTFYGELASNELKGIILTEEAKKIYSIASLGGVMERRPVYAGQFYPADKKKNY